MGVAQTKAKARHGERGGGGGGGGEAGGGIIRPIWLQRCGDEAGALRIERLEDALQHKLALAAHP